jgi:hypothetical protein
MPYSFFEFISQHLFYQTLKLNKMKKLTLFAFLGLFLISFKDNEQRDWSTVNFSENVVGVFSKILYLRY